MVWEGGRRGGRNLTRRAQEEEEALRADEQSGTKELTTARAPRWVVRFALREDDVRDTRAVGCGQVPRDSQRELVSKLLPNSSPPR